jgi:hypothetical protein
MQSETKERSFQLCQLAAVEQDPAKHLALVTEIDRMLEEEEERLKRKRRDAVAAESQHSKITAA